MILFRLVFFLLRYTLFVLRMVLFRLYLFLIFLSKDAAPFLLLVLAGGVLAVSWRYSEPPLLQLANSAFGKLNSWAATRPSSDGLAQAVQFLFPISHFILLGLAGLAFLWALGLVQRFLLFLLPAMPYMRRPVPPQWRLRARKHRIEQVSCQIAVPKLPFNWWDGDLAPLVKQLPPHLQALLEQPPAPELAEPEPVQEAQVAAVEEAEPEPQPTPIKAPKQAPKRTRPAAPRVPPVTQRPQAAE